MTSTPFLSDQRSCRTSNELLIVFDENVDDESRDAVTLTTWAAETSTRENAGPLEKNPEVWFIAFQRVLANLGWALSEQSNETSEGRAEPILRGKLGTGKGTQKLLAHLHDAGDWPERPRCVGIVQDQGHGPVMQLLLVLPAFAKKETRPTDHDPGPQSGDLNVKYCRALLNMSLYKTIESKLRDKMNGWTKARG